MGRELSNTWLTVNALRHRNGKALVSRRLFGYLRSMKSIGLLLFTIAISLGFASIIAAQSTKIISLHRPSHYPGFQFISPGNRGFIAPKVWMWTMSS